MSAQWLSSSRDASGRLGDSLENTLRSLARPERARRLRQALVLLVAAWAVVSLARLVWSLLPAQEMVPVEPVQVVNPVTRPNTGPASESVDIERMQSWHLFGEAGAETPETLPSEEVARPGENAREGIEKGARETRLQLMLRGVVASTDDGLGHAIIEHKKQQEVYAVDDKLPVSGEVVLAKVMPRQVVLDNGGTYELLTLFDESGLDAQVSPPAAQRSTPRQESVRSATTIDKRAESETTELAQRYRDRLYQNPQSLAEVVRVSAVREGGELLGYRVAPGKDQRQFEQLGFRAGDLVTAVNGVALNDPANTMRLYQTMRTASEAVFELQREQQQLSISVSLEAAGAQP